MYIPPQQDESLLHQREDAPTTFLFKRKGSGRRMKRENWTFHGRGRHAAPFAYRYVMQDGCLATISESSPEPPTMRRLVVESKQSEKLPEASRRSSPVYAAIPFSPRTTTRSPSRNNFTVERSLSLTFATHQRDASSLPGFHRMKNRALPPLPPSSPVSPVSVTKPSLPPSPLTEDLARYTAPLQIPSSSEFPQKLHHRRPAQLSDDVFAPTLLAPSRELSLTPRSSVEEQRPEAASRHAVPQKRQYEAPLTPPATPPESSDDEAATEPCPAGPRRKSSRFVELLDQSPPLSPALAPTYTTSPVIKIKKEPLVRRSRSEEAALPPVPVMPRNLVLPLPSPLLSGSKSVSDRSRNPSRVGSVLASARSSMQREAEQRTSIEIFNLLGSKAATGILNTKDYKPTPPPSRAHSTASNKLHKPRQLKKQSSLPKIIVEPYAHDYTIDYRHHHDYHQQQRAPTPLEDYMMSGALEKELEAGMERSNSMSSTQSTSSDVSIALTRSSTISVASSHSSFAPSIMTQSSAQITTAFAAKSMHPAFVASAPAARLLPGAVSAQRKSTQSVDSVATSSPAAKVCTAEVKSMALKSPVIAFGTAKLVSC